MDGCCPISSEILPSIHNNLMGRSCHNGDPMMPFSPDRQAFNAFTAHLKIVDIFTHGQAVFFSLLPRRGIFSSNHRIKNRWQLLFLFKFVPLRDWDFVSSTKEYFFIEKYHPFLNLLREECKNASQVYIYQEWLQCSIFCPILKSVLSSGFLDGGLEISVDYVFWVLYLTNLKKIKKKYT